MEPEIRCFIILFVSQLYAVTYLEKSMISGCKIRIFHGKNITMKKSLAAEY
jgi:hypothetical protein